MTSFLSNAELVFNECKRKAFIVMEGKSGKKLVVDKSEAEGT